MAKEKLVIKEVAKELEVDEELVEKVYHKFMKHMVNDLSKGVNCSFKPYFHIHCKEVGGDTEVYIPGTTKKVKRKKKIRLYLKPSALLKRLLSRE